MILPLKIFFPLSEQYLLSICIFSFRCLIYFISCLKAKLLRCWFFNMFYGSFKKDALLIIKCFHLFPHHVTSCHFLYLPLTPIPLCCEKISCPETGKRQFLFFVEGWGKNKVITKLSKYLRKRAETLQDKSFSTLTEITRDWTNINNGSD